MAMLLFSVTYERWNEESVEAGDTDDRGFIVKDVCLRDAFDDVGKYAPQASASRADDVRWFTHDTYNDGTREFYEEGITEQRSIHFPPSTTPSSVRRLAKLLGCDLRA
jgi:hypothetical protein